MTLRVLVVDDSAFFRMLLIETLTAIPDVEVVGEAPNGHVALEKVRTLQPDMVTLDMEMPEMDGLQTLEALQAAGNTASVIVVSAVTRAGGELTMRALHSGAFDFITKPSGSDWTANREVLAQELTLRVQAVQYRQSVRATLAGTSRPASVPAAPRPMPVAARPAPLPTPSPAGIACVLIGVSTGGPVALMRLLPALPATLGVPIFIVQHMPPLFTQSLAESLHARCALTVREAAPGDMAAANTVYIAPGGRQMRLRRAADRQLTIEITDDPPEHNCRPSVDYLFRSAAEHVPGRALAVILTGMGNDGTDGMRLLKRSGCPTIAQDSGSCVVYGMPRAAVDAGVVDTVLPLPAIAAQITHLVTGRAQ
jgi:two-component system chemotaxis response regulator CheB